MIEDIICPACGKFHEVQEDSVLIICKCGECVFDREGMKNA